LTNSKIIDGVSYDIILGDYTCNYSVIRNIGIALNRTLMIRGVQTMPIDIKSCKEEWCRNEFIHFLQRGKVNVTQFKMSAYAVIRIDILDISYKSYYSLAYYTFRTSGQMRTCCKNSI